MKKIILGKTGIESSQLGFGIMRMPSKVDNQDEPDEMKAIDLIKYAYSKGITYFDTAENYVWHKSEKILGHAVKDFRENITIASKVGIWHINDGISDVEKLLKSQLDRLQTEYLDFYMIHGLTDERWSTFDRIGIVKYFEQLKRNGIIRHFGFSYHGTSFFFKDIISEYDWDFVQLQVNYVDKENQAGEAGLSRAKDLGIDTIIMEPLRGGQLISGIPQEVSELFDVEFPGKSRAEIGFNWLLNRSDVDIVLSGMSTKEQINDNVRIFEKAERNMFGKKDNCVYEKATDIYCRKTKILCTLCRYCRPCSQYIDIPRVIDVYNFAHTTSSERAIKYYNTHYSEVVPKCTGCGECAEKCPQNIAIPDVLKMIHNELHYTPVH